jgi:hypothetical protein
MSTQQKRYGDHKNRSGGVGWDKVTLALLIAPLYKLCLGLLLCLQSLVSINHYNVVPLTQLGSHFNFVSYRFCSSG